MPIVYMLSLFSCVAYLSVKYKGTSNPFSTPSEALPVSPALAFTKMPRRFPQLSVICLEAQMKQHPLEDKNTGHPMTVKPILMK